MDGEIRTVHVRIEGRVQGVGYRYWTERTAQGLGLSGWVRNRTDGAVEALFSGPRDAIDAMIAACRSGPRPAAVTALSVEEQAEPPPPGFHVLPTR